MDAHPPPPSTRGSFLTRWANLVTSRPRATLALCALLSLLSVWLTLARLEFRADRSDLIDPALPWQQRYAEFKRLFPRWDDAVVVVERGQTPDSQQRADQFIEALEAKLASSPHFAAVTAGVPRASAPLEMILTQPLDKVSAVVGELARTGPVLSAPSLDGLLGLSTLGGDLGVELGKPEREGLTGLLARSADVGQGRSQSVLGMEAAQGIERLVTGSGRLALVLVSVRHAPPGSAGADDPDAAVNTMASGIAALRGAIADLTTDPRFAEVRAGVTGVPVLESDETAQSQRDARLAGFISLGLITLLMLIVYRGFVIPALAVAALLMGMAMSFGWATLAVGHLQLLSVTFASLLLGLGIDVAIHVIARLELVHPEHEQLPQAIAQTYRGVGPGILTASATVAAAAGAMALTSFSGVAEMGLIAAGGILLCTLAIMSALPAMLMLIPSPQQRLRTHEGGEARPFMGQFGVSFHRHPWAVLACSAVVTAVAAWLAAGVIYDTDLQKLMPSGTESVTWQQAIEQDDQKGVWHAVVRARDADEARRLTAALRALPEVSDVAGVGMLYLDDADLLAKRAALERLPDVTSFIESTTNASSDAPTPEADAPRVQSLRRAAGKIAKTWEGKDAALALAARRVADLSDEEARRTLGGYRADRAALLERIAGLRAARPIDPERLPQALKPLMVGSDGSLLLRVYPKDPGTGESVLSPARLSAFVKALLARAPEATGPSVQIYESTKVITHAYRQAALYALAAIVALLVLDFGVRRGGLLDALSALLPVAVGVVLMLAVMRAADVALNFANMIVMPLIIGIGVGCGVHAVRRWRMQPADEPAGLAGGSGRAITLTSLTTVIGFAAMMSGQHRGIWSLGFVMSVGLSAVWVATIIVLPPVLRVRGRRGFAPGDPAAPPPVQAGV